MGHASVRGRGARRSRRPIYYFDIVHDYPEVGGVAEFSQRLFRQLKRQYGRRLISAREAVARLAGPDTGMPYLDREKRAAELLAAADPGSIFFFPNFQSPIAKKDRHAGPRIVNVIHDVQFAYLPELFTADRRRWLNQTFAQARDNADLIVFVSRTTQEQYIAQFGAPRRHTVIYNPVASGKAHAPEGFDEPFLLTAAHHFPHKNFAGLLTLFAGLSERAPALKLYVTGHGGEKFQRDLAALPEAVRARVRHLGHVPRPVLDGLYRRARAFITLSRFEGFNMAAAEAASHGTPLILSDIPVHRELYAPQACLVDASAPSLERVVDFLERTADRREVWPLRDVCTPAACGEAYARSIDACAEESVFVDTRRSVVARATPWWTHRPIALSPPRRAGRVGLMAGALLAQTMLAGFAGTLIVAGSPTLALADGGHGGAVVAVPGGGSTAGGAGGMGFGGQDGADGQTGPSVGEYGGSGGGGGGAGGGNGGAGGVAVFGGSGGTGGTAPSPNGQPGQSGDSNSGGDGGGGGGGGGFNGNGSGGTSLGPGNLTGGNGGDGGGGAVGDYFGAGGGGGAGGYGAIVTGTGTVTSTVVITGGAGGNGGNGGASIFGFDFGQAGGSGGDGGVGVFVSSGATFDNAGTVTGGNGGVGGSGIAGSGPTVVAPAGLGGVGITGSGITVINSGSITAGISGDGVVANAIEFTGGVNTLELRAGSSIAGNVVGTGNDTLRFGGTTNATFDVSTIGSSTQYRGFGSFGKVGSSTWTLTGSNSDAATWTVNAGTLLVNGAIVGDTTVNAGGTLGGTGTAGSVTVNANGVFAPGDGTPGSHMGVSGTLDFSGGGTYRVFVNPTTASFADLAGTATLTNGAVNAVFSPGSYVFKRYTILTAGALNGTFNPAVTTTGLPADMAARLSYDATNVYLNLTLPFAVPGGLDGNQQSVADALTNFFDSTGGIPGVFAGLTADQLTQASGEGGADTTQTAFGASNLFMNMLLDWLNDGHGSSTGGEGGALGYANTAHDAADRNYDAAQAYAAVTPKDRRRAATFDHRWSLWASGYGGSASVSGDAAAGTHDTTNHIYGMAAGAGYHLSPDTLLGFALGGAGFNFDLSDGLGSGRADLFQAGVYGRHRFGNAYVAGALAYGWQDVKTDRTVTISGTDHLEAEFHAQTFAARGEAGYRFATPWVGVTPYAALQATSFHQPAYAESTTSGSSTFALSYNSQTTTNVRTELGARFDKSFLLTNGLLTLRSRIAWAHDSDTDRPVTAAFQTLPGAAFTVNGAQPAADSALVSAGAELRWANGLSLAANFEGEFSGTTQSYAGKGTIRYVW